MKFIVPLKDVLLLFVSVLFIYGTGFSQDISLPLQGSYKVISGNQIDFYKITNNKVVAIKDGRNIRTFLLVKKEGNDYLLRTGEAKKGKLIRANFQPLKNGTITAKVTVAGGNMQTLIISKTNLETIKESRNSTRIKSLNSTIK